MHEALIIVGSGEGQIYAALPLMQRSCFYALHPCPPAHNAATLVLRQE